ncbi:MAG: discoidin domain-containing protein [Tannerellaceae bacterium]|nr:discoidin domain-containing protein [Tannerellaceae bacterium]
MEQALILAGDNRIELEKVLNHYSANPGDSLKYRAAVFLIENMPIHYYKEEGYEDLYFIMDSLNNSGLKYKEINYIFDSIKKITPTAIPTIFPDIQTLSAAYLIHHIDFSFKNRNYSLWKNRVNFQTFCEYILPYACGNEKREFWIEHYQNRYAPLLQERIQDADAVNLTLRDICDSLNRGMIDSFQMRAYFLGGLPNYPPLMLDNIRSAACDEYVKRTCYAMRSLQIPVARDFTPQWNTYSRPHSWNTLCASDRHYPFQGFDEITRKWEITRKFNCPKIFRQLYSIQPNCPAAKYAGSPLPGFMQQKNIKDVTSEYVPASDIAISVSVPQSAIAKIPLLCVFNNSDWMPIHWGELKRNTATFTDMGRSNVYMPAFYTGSSLTFAGDPIMLDSTGKSTVLHPRFDKRETLRLIRKYHSNNIAQYKDRMVNARFQAANKLDFSDCENIYVITANPDLVFNTVDIHVKYQYRYIRYIVGKDTYGNVAELEFYTKHDSNYHKLSGRIIGTEGSIDNRSDLTKEVVFDGDVLTYFSVASDSDIWVGMDFGKQQRIDRIRYIPRNDDNNIRPGDLYELFYWDNGQWNSLGQKTGDDSYVLAYENCPSGALFLLHNHTRGKEERPFTYENGKQIFW